MYLQVGAFFCAYFLFLFISLLAVLLKFTVLRCFRAWDKKAPQKMWQGGVEHSTDGWKKKRTNETQEWRWDTPKWRRPVAAVPEVGESGEMGGREIEV